MVILQIDSKRSKSLSYFICKREYQNMTTNSRLIKFKDFGNCRQHFYKIKYGEEILAVGICNLNTMYNKYVNQVQGQHFICLTVY